MAESAADGQVSVGGDGVHEQVQVVQVLEDCSGLVGVGLDESHHPTQIILHDECSTSANQHLQTVEVAVQDFDNMQDSDDNYCVEGGVRKRKKPLLSLTIREKTAICRYKAQHPELSQRQIAEHFSSLWGKEVCRRRVSDILVQKDKWFEVERRVRDDVDKTFRDGRFSQLEKLVYEWIVDVVRSGGRVWDEDIRACGKRLAEMNEFKNFVPSNGWIHGFKKRYGLKNMGDSGEVLVNLGSDVEMPRNENQMQLSNEEQTYTVNISMDHQRDLQPIRVNHSKHRANDLSDIDTGDSDDGGPDNIGLTQTSVNTGMPVATGGNLEHGMVLDDIVKTIIYGSSSAGAQATGAATGAAAAMNGNTDNSFYEETPHPPESKTKQEIRANMAAVLVRKVLTSTKRKLDAETEMIRELRNRHLSESKMFEERRRKYAEERDLIAVQKRKLEAEAKYFHEQQRNEIIRRELLLADVASIKQSSSRVHSHPINKVNPTTVQLPKGFVTVVRGSE